MKRKKFARTEKKIVATFYRLAEQGELPSVRDICDSLDISVSTFYCHFTGIKDILLLESENLQEKLVDMNQQIFPDRPYVMTKEKMTKIITFAQENRRENLLLLRPELKLPYREFLEKIVFESADTALARVFPERRTYVAEFISEGIIKAINKWLDTQSVPVEEFVDIVFSLVNSGIRSAQIN